MRKTAENANLSVRAIAGTQVVLLGLDIKADAREGLLGFALFRRVEGEPAFVALKGNRYLPGETERRGTDEVPLQAFLWGDYSIGEGTTVTYRIVPCYGTLDALEQRDGVEITLQTEDPDDETHGVFFNRGVAGSQAYSRRFGEHRRWYETSRGGWKEFIKPDDVPDRAAYRWLSRGLEEAMLAFIGQAKGSRYALRASVYEFTWEPVIQALVDALEGGADVKIVRHAKLENVRRLKRDTSKVTRVLDKATGEPIPDMEFKSYKVEITQQEEEIGQAAEEALRRVGVQTEENRKRFEEMVIKRTNTSISHNKFIILLKDGVPVQVWTGSTNFTDGGIFGQSNVGHVIRDPAIAAAYLRYWEKLSTDPEKKSRDGLPEDELGMRNWNSQVFPDIEGAPPAGAVTPMFSPRLKVNMLQWYAARMAAASEMVCFTAAFSIDQNIFEVVKEEKDVGDAPYLRYLLLESRSAQYIKPKFPEMAACPQNRLAWGDVYRHSDDDQHDELIESLTGLNTNVNYVHTKYALLDPLSDDPVVISGSANFSKASTQDNDENMLIIRGNTRVADIFLVEFMRLFRHFQARNEHNALPEAEAEAADIVRTDDAWSEPWFTEGEALYRERRLFSAWR